jgi:hypothetical protein
MTRQPLVRGRPRRPSRIAVAGAPRTPRRGQRRLSATGAPVVAPPRRRRSDPDAAGALAAELRRQWAGRLAPRLAPTAGRPASGQAASRYHRERDRQGVGSGRHRPVPARSQARAGRRNHQARRDASAHQRLSLRAPHACRETAGGPPSNRHAASRTPSATCPPSENRSHGSTLGPQAARFCNGTGLR